MLNTTSAFGFRGGLREATAWLCLRQDIYISLISQQPLRTNLRNFRRSNVFLKNDDFSWANKMVFLLSEVLSCAFNDSPSSSSCHILRTLHQEVEDWKVRKPATFTPIRFVPRGRNKEHRLPEIWMLSPVHGKLPAKVMHGTCGNIDNQSLFSGWSPILPHRQDCTCRICSTKPSEGL
jgi:hypothetical protein